MSGDPRFEVTPKFRHTDSMGHEEELTSLRKEWRDGVQLQLTELRDGQAKIFDVLNRMREDFVKIQRLDEVERNLSAKISALEDRCKLLEQGKARFLGIAFGIQLVIIAVAWAIEHKVLFLGH